MKTPDDMSPEKFIHSMIGYHLTVDNSLCGMAMTQGTKRRVVNIGLGIKQFAVHPKGASVDAYVQSLQHKVRACLCRSRHPVANSYFILFIY